MVKAAQGHALFDVSASKAGFDAELDAMFRTPQAAAAPAPRAQRRGANESVDESESDEEEDNEEEEEADVDEEDAEEEDVDEDVDEDDEDREPSSEEAASEAEAEAEMGDAAAAADAVPTSYDGTLEEISDVEDMDEAQLKAFLDTPEPTKSRPKRALEDADEDEGARNLRTIFVGNIPIAATTSRALRKQLIRHLEQLSPYPECTKIVSLRFRSVSFKTPTNDFTQDEAAANATTRRRERARKFREKQGMGEKDAAPNAPPPLTAQQKRKIAFINHELNERADAVNAYVRLGDPRKVHAELVQQHKTEAPLDPRVTGHILAALVARAISNTLFGERHLRADLVAPLTPQEVVETGLDKLRLADGTQLGAPTQADLKRTVFVGNLDFEAGEEEVRALFEKLVREERGAPPMQAAPSLRLDGAPSGEPVPQEWVQSVRIVRDKATQLGKGFAYVKFLDAACVDELLALHEAEEAFVASKRPQVRGKPQRVARPIQLADGETFRRRVKLRKRALRLSRCKNTQGRRRAAHAVKRRPDAARVRSSGAPTPNGSSPTVRSAKEQASKASFLATLSKEQRVAVKKGDADRQARRLQKKQAKKQGEKAARKLGARREKVPLPQRSAAKKMTKQRK
ncbi:NOP12 [Malassezia furfur]|nr:NOP12 [Malassezia furfur]